MVDSVGNKGGVVGNGVHGGVVGNGVHRGVVGQAVVGQAVVGDTMVGHSMVDGGVVRHRVSEGDVAGAGEQLGGGGGRGHKGKDRDGLQGEVSRAQFICHFGFTAVIDDDHIKC
jgi:hypothetical protein